MPNGFEIRPLTLEEMNIPVSWAKAEGWNPGLHDASPFWHTDPKGFLGGFLDSRPVGVISAVRYDGMDDPEQRGSFGFVGFYIAHPDYRGQAYAWKLGKAAIAHLSDVSSIGLDGVIDRQENYQAFGFNYAHRNVRYRGQTPLPQSVSELLPDEKSISAHDLDFEKLCLFDAEHFPTMRRTFLKAWIDQPEHDSLAIIDEHQSIKGYGVIRPCFDGFKIGPLFAQDARLAEILIGQLCGDLPADSAVFIDPPTENIDAIDLLQRLGMTMVFETARMYKGTTPNLPTDRIFGITSFELG